MVHCFAYYCLHVRELNTNENSRYVRCYFLNTNGVSDFLLHLVLLGGVWDLLHNSYVKGGLAVGALLGPGRGLLFLKYLFLVLFSLECLPANAYT